MKIATLAIILNEKGQILLGEKKRGEIGTGQLSGPGGKLEEGETLEQCLVRETWEELGIRLALNSLKLVAYIVFYRGRTRFNFLNHILNWFDLGSVSDFGVYVYHARILSGLVHETDDMIPNWYPLNDDTFARTYESDRHWLARAARGDTFNANVFYRGRAKDFDRIEFLPFHVPNLD